jgi:hypothetical protein
MGMTLVSSRLSATEEAYLQALLWEEANLVTGPATRAALDHGLSLLRCLEAANRLSPTLHGAGLARIQEGPCPLARWPWEGLTGAEVLGVLWRRLDPGGKDVSQSDRKKR